MPRALADDGYRWFAAVFLDAELQGGPLEGPHLDDVVENFLLFLNHTEAGKYHLSEDTFTAINLKNAVEI